MNPVVKPISVVLKEARQSKGLSLEEAYKATKIHPKILHALEEGTTLGLSHIYVKSYIKIYAKYLGVSHHELDRYFHSPVVIPKEKRIKLDISTIADKGERLHDLAEPMPLSGYSIIVSFLKKAAIILGIILVLVIIFKLLPKKEIALDRSNISESASLNKTAKARQTAPQVAKESFPKIGDTLRLTIFAEEDIWMQVKVDGKVVFRRILKKGSSETWQAKDGFDLWLANAGIVKLELNGKILPPIGRRGQLLKSVVITREGLTVNK